MSPRMLTTAALLLGLAGPSATAAAALPARLSTLWLAVRLGLAARLWLGRMGSDRSAAARIAHEPD